MIVVGVDGCRFGWVAARVDLENDEPSEKLKMESFLTFEEIVDAYTDAAAIAVDIPIGLIECQRRADIEARAVLGRRKSSVFPAPDPRVVHLEDYWEANTLMRKLCGKGVSKQAFALFPKVREVNEVVVRRDPEQQTIVEIHPEICFWAMNGGHAMCHPKRERNGNGYEERLALLESWTKLPLWQSRKEAREQAKGTQADDVLDAIAAAWTATLFAKRHDEAERFPKTEERDGNGLPAEIIYGEIAPHTDNNCTDPL